MSPSFNPCESCFGRMMVWIRPSRLNMMYFHDKATRTIAAMVGRPIKVDLVTKTMERGHFARVCVKIDLAQPVVDQVWMCDHQHAIELESLHLICSTCGCFGHVAKNCVVVPDPGGDGALMKLDRARETLVNLENQSRSIDPRIQQVDPRIQCMKFGGESVKVLNGLENLKSGLLLHPNITYIERV